MINRLNECFFYNCSLPVSDQSGPKQVEVCVLTHYCKSNEVCAFVWFTFWQLNHDKTNGKRKISTDYAISVSSVNGAWKRLLSYTVCGKAHFRYVAYTNTNGTVWVNKPSALWQFMYNILGNAFCYVIFDVKTIYCPCRITFQRMKWHKPVLNTVTC